MEARGSHEPRSPGLCPPHSRGCQADCNPRPNQKAQNASKTAHHYHTFSRTKLFFKDSLKLWRFTDVLAKHSALHTTSNFGFSTLFNQQVLLLLLVGGDATFSML